MISIILIVILSIISTAAIVKINKISAEYHIPKSEAFNPF